MDPDEARRKLHEGGVMLCLDVPQGTELHCDMAGLVVGPKFRGIKMLPPGLHLFCWDAGHDKHAIVLVFPRGHVETWQWNLQNEDLEPVADNDERERLVYAVRSNSFDRELGQYPEDANEGWPRVSYLITLATVQRMGLGGGVRTSSSAEQTTFDREYLRDAPVKAVFTTLQLARRCDGMSPQEVSEYNMDGTMRLVDTLRSASLTWRELLAEVQMAFILFLAAASFDALEFWKQAVALMCTCGKGFSASYTPHASGDGDGDVAAAPLQHTVEDHVEMMSEFIRVLRRQLEHVPADFFRDELAKANFLGPALAALLQLGEAAVGDLMTRQQQDARINQKVNVPLFERRLRRLKSLLAQRFGLAADELDADLLANHEDAPVVVDAATSSAHVDADSEPRASAGSDPETTGAPGAAAVATPAVSVPRMSWMLEPPT